MIKARKKILKGFISLILVAAMEIQPFSTVVVHAAQYLDNLPRYVNFSSPRALTLQDIGIYPDLDGDGNQESEPASEILEKEETEKEETEETEKEEVLDAREPEDFYQVEIDEPDGELVQFDHNSRTYHIGGNEYITILGGYSGLYLDEDGNVQEIDHTLTETEKGGLLRSLFPASTAYENTNGEFHVRLPKEITSSEGIRMEKEGYSIELIPTEGDFSRSMVANNAIRYTDVFDQIDVQYTLVGNSIKEDIILMERVEKNEFMFEIKAPGLSIQQNQDKILLFDEEIDNPVFILEAPAMEDAAGNMSFDVEIKLIQDNESYLAVVTANQEWLQAEERKYPVRIDPSTFSMVPAEFYPTYVAQGTPDTFYANNSYPHVGYEDGIGNTRTYFAINGQWQSLINGALVTEATFQVGQKTNHSNGASVFELYAPTASWNAQVLTWNSQKDFTHTYIGRKNAVGSDQMLVYDITDMMNSWINTTRLQAGLMLRAEYEPMSEEQLPMKMPGEVLYNHNSAALGPRIDIKWSGDLNGELSLRNINDLTIKVSPFTEDTLVSRTALGVAAYGLSQGGSEVTYTLTDGEEEQEFYTTAADSYLYPDFSFAGAYPNTDNSQPRNANWQSGPLIWPDLVEDNKIYRIRAQAEGVELTTDPISGETIPGEAPAASDIIYSDYFLLYEVKALDLLRRIAKHYGVAEDTIRKDNNLPQQLTVDGDVLLIRNPKNVSPYTAKAFTLEDEILIDMLLKGMGLYCLFNHEPINMNTGNFYMSQSDAVFEELGGSFSIDRNYNSIASYFRSEFGIGWNSPFGEHLTMMADGRILYLKGDGGVLPFEKGTDGIYYAPKGYDMILEEGWKLTEADGTVRHFDQFGFLTSKEDLKGYKTNYEYDDDYNLKKIVTPSGIFVVTTDEEYRISEIELPGGGKITYEYDEADHLIAVTDAEGGVRRYEYDDEHRMTAWYDENGTRIILNTFDDKGRVKTQTDANGNVVYIEYQAGSMISTDNNGNTTIYYLDDQKRTIKVLYPDGALESTQYDDHNRIAEKTDELGITTRYTYDNNGNILTMTREDGAVTYYEYNELNLLTSSKDYLGNVISYTYDSAGNMLSFMDQEGNTTTYQYDNLNRRIKEQDPRGSITAYEYEGAVVTSITDGEGNTSHMTYDEMNRLLTKTDALGNTESYVYDQKGRVIKETAKDGGVTSYVFTPEGTVQEMTGPLGEKIQFTYDDMHNLLSLKDSLGNTLRYEYDGNYNKIKEIDQNGNTTSYAYDSRNRLIEVIDPEGGSLTYTYDRKGNQVESTDKRGNISKSVYDPVLGIPISGTDPLGNTTEFTYDLLGCLTTITFADSSRISYIYDGLGRIISTTDQLGLITNITYDENGNVIKLVDNGTREYQYSYNRNNLMVKSINPLGGVVTCEYDALGNLITTTNEEGHASSFAYDAVGRLKRTTDALGNITSKDYNKNGNLLSETDANGGIKNYYYNAISQLIATKDAGENVSAFENDGLGNLMKQTDALGGITTYHYNGLNNVIKMQDALGYKYQYEYDRDGNNTVIILPTGDRVTMEYDALSRVISRTDAQGLKTEYTYDSMGRVTKATDNAGNVMSYIYDASGHVIRQTDALLRDALYEYDIFGRVLSVTGTDGATTTHTYDELDRLLSITDGEGKTTTYEYDSIGNLKKTTEPGEAVYSYTYDAIGRLTKKIDPLTATTSFLYDSNGNLTKSTDRNGIVTEYSYDPLNRLTKLTDGNGNPTAYTYDALSRLASVQSAEGNLEEYRYDALGNLTKRKDANGLITEYKFDAFGNKTYETSPKNVTTTYKYNKQNVLTEYRGATGYRTLYDVDLNGRVTRMTQPNGGIYTYEYDVIGRLTDSITPLGYEKHYTYDVADNVIEEKDNLDRTTSYTYDVMHRLISSTDPLGGIESYQYDVRGNMSQATNPLGISNTYTYNLLDQLTEATDPEGKATKYVYDLEGNITNITKPGDRTSSYQYDGVYNVVAAMDAKGYRYETLYNRDGRIIKETDPLSQSKQYTYDAGGRLTELTDKIGKTLGYAYDPHGNVITMRNQSGQLTKYEYDTLNRLIRVVDPLNRMTSYGYDKMDNMTSMTDALGRKTSYTYDLENNRTSMTDSSGRKETMNYDVSGRFTSYLSPGGNRIKYDYDKLNQLLEKSYEDANGNDRKQNVLYGYDAAGQKVSMYDSIGNSTYQYDQLGRITGVTGASGLVVTYTYDEGGRLSSIGYPDGTSVAYRYDKNDNLVSVTDRNKAVTSYEYDALNRVIKMIRPNKVVTSNTYNANDQIVTMENTCGECGYVLSRYQYTYDERGYIVGEISLESLPGVTGKHLSTVYKESVTGLKCSNKAYHSTTRYETTRRYVYDTDGQLKLVVEDEKTAGELRYTYAYDDAGNRIQYARVKVTDSTKDLVINYEYNQSNQLIRTTQTKPTKIVEDFTYDKDGNMVTKKRSGSVKETISYDYTVENRLKAVYNGKELLMASAYDGDGNRVFQLNYAPVKDDNWLDTCYNAKGNGITEICPDVLIPVKGQVSAAETELISLIKSGKGSYELIEYVNDVTQENAEVLMEYNMNGKALAAYTYGNERLSVDKKSFTGYYLYDPRGSVSGLVDGVSAVKDGYQYEPFGNMSIGKPKRSNVYAYNGESYNGNLEMQYLRARYYDTVNGNFISEDRYLGDVKEPLTLNRYKYVVGNPVNYRDPSGHMAQLKEAALWIAAIVVGVCAVAAAAVVGTSAGTAALAVVGAVFAAAYQAVGLVLAAVVIFGVTYYVIDRGKAVAAGLLAAQAKAKVGSEIAQINWDVSDNTKNHIANGTDGKHNNGWKKFGFDPKDPNFFTKILPFLKVVVDEGEKIVDRDAGNGGRILEYFKYFSDKGMSIWVRIFESANGAKVLSDACEYTK